jgi:dTDP-glucose 4,6-dehydratase
MPLLSIWFSKGVNHAYIGGFNEWQNIDLVKLLCQIMDRSWGIREFQNN